MNKNMIIYGGLSVGVIVVAVVYFYGNMGGGNISPTETPRPIVSPDISPTVSSIQTGPVFPKTPSPTIDGRTSFINESVPWSLLLADASCELKGEIQFLDHSTAKHLDAALIYRGVDHPARGILWTVTPQDDLSVGPNMFSGIEIPNGEVLLSVVLPAEPKSKTYDLTAKIQYGRLVDEKGNFVTAGGNVKVSEKQCLGKTRVTLP